MSTSTVSLSCRACGSSKFSYPPNPKPTDKVTCQGCGATGSYGDVMESGKRQVVDKIAQDLKKAFGKFK